MLADSPATRQILLSDPEDGSFGPSAARAFASTSAEVALLLDESGRIVGSWSKLPPEIQQAAAPGQTLSDWLGRPDRTALRRHGGLIQLPSGIAVFHEVEIRDHADPNRVLGGLWLARRVGAALLDKIGASVEASIILVPAKTMVEGQSQGGNPLRPLWITENGNLVTVWGVHDAAGEMLGYFRAELSGVAAHRQAITTRRVTLIVLSLSLGLAILVIVGTHVLVTGPVVRLLQRLRQIEAGKRGVEGLTSNLHGEPLLLARQLESAFEKLAVMAKTDQLTGLANRRQFGLVLEAMFHQARRYGRPLSLLVMDVDVFKSINDTWGHAVGDDVLRITARTLKEACRRADLPARIGGDEFCLILPETSASSAQELAERVRAAVSRQGVMVDSAKVAPTVSAGIADLDSEGVTSADAMMAQADRALYRAKNLGRNRVVLARQPGQVGSREEDELAMSAERAVALDVRKAQVVRPSGP